VDDAGLIFGLAAALVLLPSQSLVRYLIRVATAPIRTAEHELEHLLSGLRRRVLGLGHFVRHNVWARIGALAAAIAGIAHELPHLRARDRAIEREIAKLRDWVRHRKITLTTGAFLGAFAWALTKLGVGWIRCANWKRIGREVCRMPSSRITELLGLLTGVFVLANIRTLAQFAEAIEEDAAKGVAELVGVVVGESGSRFTIE
jgi:hypothetical protein